MWITVCTVGVDTTYALNHTICPAAEKYNSNED